MKAVRRFLRLCRCRLTSQPAHSKVADKATENMASIIQFHRLHCVVLTHMQFSSEAKSIKGGLKETGRKLISDLYQLEASKELGGLDDEGTRQMIGMRATHWLKDWNFIYAPFNGVRPLYPFWYLILIIFSTTTFRLRTLRSVR